jgi:hypothetical protein
MAQSGGTDWNPPDNSFKVTLEDVYWDCADPDSNTPQAKWGVSLSGTKYTTDYAQGNLSLMMVDAWIASRGQIFSADDDGEHEFRSEFMPYEGTRDLFIYKDDDNTVDTYYNTTKALDNVAQTKDLNYLTIQYTGHMHQNYQELTIETFIFQKWVDPEPSHDVWESEESIDVAPGWDETPSNQVIAFGTPFYYDVNASDVSGIASYWINDTVNFAIDSEGRITDVTSLAVGEYGLEIRAYDPYGLYSSASIKITVNPPPMIPGFPIEAVLLGFVISIGVVMVVRRKRCNRRK